MTARDRHTEPSSTGYDESGHDTQPERCPVHGIPDCSPLLNGCARVIRDRRFRDRRDMVWVEMGDGGLRLDVEQGVRRNREYVETRYGPLTLVGQEPAPSTSLADNLVQRLAEWAEQPYELTEATTGIVARDVRALLERLEAAEREVKRLRTALLNDSPEGLTERAEAAETALAQRDATLAAVRDLAQQQRDEIRGRFKETGAAPARDLGYADACDDVLSALETGGQA